VRSGPAAHGYACQVLRDLLRSGEAGTKLGTKFLSGEHVVSGVHPLSGLIREADYVELLESSSYPHDLRPTVSEPETILGTGPRVPT
jgi:hypothetical protein